MKKILFYLLPLTLFACVLVACKSSKKTAEVVALQNMNRKERFAQLLQSEIAFSTLSANLRLSLQNGEKPVSMSIEAQLRIRHNEALQLSLRVPLLGSEAIRLVMTPDKVLIIDRLNKQYVQEPMSVLQAQFPFLFDYYMAEALWTNRLFLAGKSNLSEQDLSGFAMENDKYTVRLKYSDNYDTDYIFSSDHTARIQSTKAVREFGNLGVECVYTDWGQTSQQQTFPMAMQWKLLTNDQPYLLNVAFKSVDIDTSVNIDRNIPNKYTQVSLQQLIHTIKNFL